MFTAFPFVSIFFSSNPFGKWLKSKAFMLLGILLVLAITAMCYVLLVNKIEREQATKLLVKQQNDDITRHTGEIVWLKASAKSTADVLGALDETKKILSTQSQIRATAVTTKIQSIAKSADAPALKAENTSAVYATALQDAYCAAAPEACSSISPEK